MALVCIFFWQSFYPSVQSDHAADANSRFGLTYGVWRVSQRRICLRSKNAWLNCLCTVPAVRATLVHCADCRREVMTVIAQFLSSSIVPRAVVFSPCTYKKRLSKATCIIWCGLSPILDIMGTPYSYFTAAPQCWFFTGDPALLAIG